MSQITIANRTVGPIGLGLMGMTWTVANPTLPSQDQSFAVMDTALSSGPKLFNGGEIYGTPERNSNHLLRAYLEKYPEKADKIVLSIKGGVNPDTHALDGSEAGVRRTVEDSNKALGGVKQIDIFQYARVDKQTPIEETIGYLKKLQDEGAIGSIGLSEVRASTIERAHKITPIAAVEVELSLWTPDILRNGVAETCARLGIPIVAYSPLSRGGLTGKIQSVEDFAEGDSRRHFPKFQGELLKMNLKLNEEVEELAGRKRVSKSQIAINWVSGLSGRRVRVSDAEGLQKEVVMPIVIPIPGSTKTERVEENSTVVKLSDEEFGELMDIVERNPVVSGTLPC